MRFHSRLGRVQSLLPLAPAVLPPVRLRSSADVLAVLEEQINAVRADPTLHAVAKARVVRVLAGLALKAIETGTMAARIEMLETILKQRKGDSQ